MSAPFIDATGFHAFGLANWKSEIEALWQTAFGSAIDLSATGPDGQIVGGLTGFFTDLEQLAETVYLARSPSGARGAGLSRLVPLNGISRKAAQFSTAPVAHAGTPGTVITAGSLIGSASDPTKPPWQTVGSVTIGGGGTITGSVQCTVAGPITAAAGDLTKKITPISGWTSVTNTADAAPGLQVEADPALRARRAASVAMPSQALSDGLEAALLNLAGVTDAVVYLNNTGATDGKGLPAHSVNAIVLGGSAADIANAIWVKSSMGVTKVGAQSLVVNDTQGNPQLMQWDVPTDLDAYITIKLDRTPTNIAYIQAQFGAAIVAYYAVDGDLPAKIGLNISWADILTPVNALGLTGRQGLPSITNVFLGSAASPTLQVDLVVLYNQLAVLDTSRILVVGP